MNQVDKELKLMGTQNKILLNTHLRFVNMGSINGFLHQKLLPFAASFWVFVSTLFHSLFGLFNRTMFSVRRSEISQTNDSNCLEFNSHSVERKTEAEEPEDEVSEFKDAKEIEELEEKETPKFFFKFQFQTHRGEDNETVASNSVPSTSANKYEFLSEKDSSHYLEEPEAVSLTVKELYVDSSDDFIVYKDIMDSEFSSEKDFAEKESEAEYVHEEVEENSADSGLNGGARKKHEEEILIEEETEKLEAENSIEESSSKKGKAVVVESNVLSDEDVSSDGDDPQFLSEKDFILSDSDSDSIVSSRELINRYVASTSDGFISDKDLEDVFELDIFKNGNGEKAESIDEDLELEYLNLQNLNAGYEADDFDEEDSDIMEELKKLEDTDMENPVKLGSEMLSGKDFDGEDSEIMGELKKVEEAVMENAVKVDLEMLCEKDFEDKNNSKQKEGSCSNNEAGDSSDRSESISQNSAAADSEDSNGLETLWEHQDLIEQLKMELKKVRATGLPTILEEDESPKITEDLKPWKIDEKFQHEDRMDELHKFYKSYRERMRKFDILNYQKMYAMSFLQSKDPLQSVSKDKPSAATLASTFSQKFLLSKRKNSGSDPMTNFIRELHSDLEVVYVGQLCLSWEILHWQYEKSLELWDSDPYGMRQYNEVAGEFQQFQVLLQRFIENEPFEGPRVQNYIKHRCVLRNLLQVPVIREDSMKDKKARRKGKDDDSITSDMLVEIMEESIRIFWRFVRSDKDAQTVIPKGRKGTQIEPQDPTELELLTEVRTNLLKKEKRLKDILRGGNCILKKFQKRSQEDNSDQVLFFFSQMDMKLVARVLNMSKVTMDQLLWCHNKLSKINFVSRKIRVEPSFLLFPC